MPEITLKLDDPARYAERSSYANAIKAVEELGP